MTKEGSFTTLTCAQDSEYADSIKICFTGILNVKYRK